MNAVLSRAAADISRNESRWLNRSDLASRGKDVTALVVTPIFPFEEDTPTDEDISRTPERMRMASAVSTDSLVGDFPSLGTFSKRTALDFTPFVQNK